MIIAEFYRERGFSRKKQNKLIESLNDFIESIKFDKKNEFTYSKMGLTYVAMGDTLKGCECFKRDLSLSYYHFEKYCK